MLTWWGGPVIIPIYYILLMIIWQQKHRKKIAGMSGPGRHCTIFKTTKTWIGWWTFLFRLCFGGFGEHKYSKRGEEGGALLRERLQLACAVYFSCYSTTLHFGGIYIPPDDISYNRRRAKEIVIRHQYKCARSRKKNPEGQEMTPVHVVVNQLPKCVHVVRWNELRGKSTTTRATVCTYYVWKYWNQRIN